MDHERIGKLVRRLGQVTEEDCRTWPELYLAASEIAFRTNEANRILSTASAAITLNFWARSGERRFATAAPDMTIDLTNVAAVPERQDILVGAPVTNGFYTVEFQNGEYRTLRVAYWAARDCQCISFLNGPDNGSDYTGCAALWKTNAQMFARFASASKLIDAIKVLVATPDRGRLTEAYARRSGRCARCNRMITRPDSLRKGMGEECWSKAA